MTCIAVSPAVAAEFGHYAPGLPNIRDFFLQEPGFYYAQYHFYYTSNDFRDADGDSVDKVTISRSRSGTRSGRRDISTPYGSVSVELAVKGTAKATARIDLDVKYDTAGISPTVMYIPECEILGGKFGMYLSVPAVYTRLEASVDADIKLKLGANGTVTLTGPGASSFSRSGAIAATFSRHFHAEVDDDQFNLGDIFFQPVWLGWDGKHYAVSFGYGVYAPTGEYSPDALDNTGLGFWTHQVQAAAAWYPWEHQGTAVTLAGAYEIHHNKRHTDIRPGSHISLNYGVSQYLPLNKEGSLLAEIGVTGYSQWQVTDDRGSDVDYDAGVHDEVHAAGAQLGLAHTKWNAMFLLRWLHEYGARDRFQGDFFGITLVKGF